MPNRMRKSEQITDVVRGLNDNYKVAARMLKRANGASVEDLAAGLHLPEDSARALVSRLRTKGLVITNIERRRWRLEGVELANDN